MRYKEFDLWLEADHGVKSDCSLWESRVGKARGVQTICAEFCPEVIEEDWPFVRFYKQSIMCVVNLDPYSGPATFIALARSKNGCLISGVLDDLDAEWNVHVITTNVHITDALLLTPFDVADVALLAYKRGALSDSQKQTAINHINEKYGLNKPKEKRGIINAVGNVLRQAIPFSRRPSDATKD